MGFNRAIVEYNLIGSNRDLKSAPVCARKIVFPFGGIFFPRNAASIASLFATC